MTRQAWIKIVVIIGVLIALVLGAVQVTSPGKVPLIVREATARSGKLCLLLEGDEREACVEIAAVASALALRPAPSGSGGEGGAGGGVK
jgi:hypothetical protein